MRARSSFLSVFLFVAASVLWSEPLVHVVAKGETLYSISREYKVSVDAILRANGIADARKVYVGARLTIPSLYVVRKGDTFYGLARAWGIGVQELLAMNGLKEGAVLHAGDSLVVPGKAAPNTPDTVATTPASGTTPKSDTPPKADPAGASSPASGKRGAWPASGEVVYLRGKLFGVSIRTAKSAPIMAVRSGTVVSSGPFRGFGNVAFVLAKDSLVYVYGGAETLSVRVGDQVEPGTVVGITGLDMVVGEPIAYFFVFKNGDAIDPGKVPRE